MKYLITLLALVFLGLSVFAQEGQELSKPPQIFPVSPEAASLGKYGEIPVNLSTGKINHNIPLHTINEAGLSLPISLSYNYSGLMIETIPGSTGLGWDLVGKGMITRQIRGIADEGQLGYIGINEIGKKVAQFHTNDVGMTVEEQGMLIRESASGRWDTESDKYMISVGSLSATFYFNHNGEAVFAPYKNYKLNRLPSNGGFELIDDKGIKYYFIDKETSSQEVINNTGGDFTPYTSAWVLNRIELPNTKEITFTYINYHTSQKLYSDSWAKVLPFSSDVTLCQNEANLSGTFSTTTFTETLGLMVSTISTPKETINFEYTIKDPLDTSEGQNPVTLDAVKVVNSLGQNIMQYGFSYRNETTKYKLLEAIHKGKHNPQQEKNYYRFEYFGDPIDNIAYYKQDYWGYYSGNTNTTGSLISENANRAPDFNSTRLGALKKIIYPTKGSSEIIYEQNDVFGQQDTGEIGIEDRLDTPIDVVVTSDDYEGTEFVNELITIPFTPKSFSPGGTAAISLWYYLHGSGSGAIATATLKRVDTQSTLIPCATAGATCNYKSEGAVSEQNPVTKNLDKTLYNLVPGDYELTIFVERPANVSNPINSPRAVASVHLRYFSGNASNPQEPTFANIPFGGIRVAKVKSCDGEGNCLTKGYSYHDENNKSTGINLSIPKYERPEYHNYTGNALHSKPPKVCYVVRKTSSSNVPLSTYIGSPVLYKSVSEYQEGNSGEQLKTRYEFSGVISPTENYPFAPTEKRNWRKGLVLKQESFKKDNTSYNPVAITTNVYGPLERFNGISSNLNSYNLKTGQIGYYYNSGGHLITYTYRPDLYQTTKYVNRSELYPLLSSTQEQIHHNKTITQNSAYTYDNPYGHLKTQTTTDSNGSTMTTTHTYPYDKSGTVHNLLVAQNKITSPVETQTTKDAIVLGTQVTEFKDWGNGIILPEITKIGKGTKTPEPRLIYHKYDQQGNPLEVSQESGSRIMYIWGYDNTQPIVKIENASYTGIPAAVTTLINQLKTTSDTENTAAKENAMRSLFKDLRDHAYFANAQISGYTYDPLIGVTTMTNPQGQTVYYKYDDLNRLQYVLDQDEHIVQKTNYNYANQQTDQYGAFTINVTSPGLVTPNKPISFTASFAGGTGQFLYTWKVNGIQEQCDTSATFTKTFTSEGEYTIYVLAYDTQTKRSVSKTLVVSVQYPPLATPTISDPYPDIIEGTQVTYTASNVSGGSGDLRYEWYLNGTKQSTTTTSFTYNFPANGTYTVYFKVIDNESGESVNSNQRTMRVYNPLIGHAISGKPHIVKGTTVSFSGTGFAGGSGQRRYEWFINGAKQSATGTGMSYRFINAGTYTVKLRVIDTKVQPTHYRDTDYTVKSYNPMVVNVTPGNASLNNSTPSVRFNITSVTGGSGYYTRTQWKLWRLSNPSWTRNVGSGSSYTVGVNENGEYELSVTYTDTRTGQIVLKTMPIIVNKSSGGDGPIGEQF
ncbi:hypothetical protein [Aquimarina sp. AU474]|uniref:hypothetical protein n=1 Tax=Aquimarina sp. AU474 TaxID=2108529 RepID=UPI000D69BCF6|nr:hypothetical protein [Aquimarina sp. AU474]